MPTTPPPKPASPTLSTDEPIESPDSDTAESKELPDTTSEVSKRLSLLGKLIIPPAPR